METPGGGILGRLGEKVLGWIALGLIVVLGIGIWQMGPDGRAALWSGIWRSIAFVLICAALPWSATLFIRRLMDIGENWVGVALIAGLTLVNVIVGLILLGGLPSGGWGWFVAIAAVGVAGTYNFLVCEYLAERSA